ncbi:MAG: phage tail protein [Sphingobium limneticum]
MRKADSLRQWLTAFLPDLKTHPDRLHIWVEGGQIGTRKSRTLSFAYAYTLKVGIWEFAGDADTIMVPMLAWIEKEQPQLLHRSDSQPFGFEAELLDSEASDIVISIDLTEPVLVLPREDGSGYDVQHPPEPDYSGGFGDGGATFSEVLAGAEPVFPDVSA